MNNEHTAHSNVQDVDVEITREDIARAIAQLAYRKAYAQRPEVKEARKVYQQERARKIKAAMEYVKMHPEVVR